MKSLGLLHPLSFFTLPYLALTDINVSLYTYLHNADELGMCSCTHTPSCIHL